jgi:transcriptional regulator with XRE-family HTH domain
MALKNFHKVIAETPEDVKIFVRHSMDILDRIHELLEERFDGKQKLLAAKLGKSEAEVSKILNGVQNFTVKTLSRLEWAFGASIIAVCTSDLNAEFIPVKTQANKGCKLMSTGDRVFQEEQFDKIAMHWEKKDSIKIGSLAS